MKKRNLFSVVPRWRKRKAGNGERGGPERVLESRGTLGWTRGLEKIGAEKGLR